jgi:DNA repair protein RadC
VKEIAPHDRPREKLARIGRAGLGDNELLAVVLGSGGRRTDALAVANAILDEAGGLHGVPRLDHDDLCRIHGVGVVKAAQVLAAVELGRRTLVRRPAPREPFMSPHQIAAYLLPQFGTLPVEQFGVLLLDTKYRLMRTAMVSVGTLDSAPAHPRDVFREATRAGAAVVVLFHNHPSGDPRPSDDDRALTHRLVQAGEIVGIKVLDHLILADAKYFSFREAGRL